MRVCGGWWRDGGRIPFLLRESAVAGMPPPVFSDRHQTKRKKEKKAKKKRKEPKEKKRFIIYIFVFKK
jgi:Zn-finger nucleic acid-binding protein